MRRVLAVGVLFVLLVCVFSWQDGFAEDKWANLVDESGKVLEDIQDMPDKGIPDDLLRSCKAIAIFPSTVSGGFIIGGKYGEGIIMVRNENSRSWSPPAFFTIAGGSFGLQIGGQATDFILLIMSSRSVDGLLQGKFKLGADAAVSAGPVGRNAEAATDIQFKGGILAYSRSRGLFAGIRLDGDVIAQDWEANAVFYGKRLSAREILLERKIGMPKSASRLLKILNKYR